MHSIFAVRLFNRHKCLTVLETTIFVDIECGVHG